MSDHSQLQHYKFDKVDRFLRCTYTGGNRQWNVDWIVWVSGDDMEWHNVDDWERLADNDYHRKNIESALLKHRYEQALERAKQPDESPLPMPTTLSDSIQEVIRHAVIASNIETYSGIMNRLDLLEQQKEKVEHRP